MLKKYKAAIEISWVEYSTAYVEVEAENEEEAEELLYQKALNEASRNGDQPEAEEDFEIELVEEDL